MFHVPLFSQVLFTRFVTGVLQILLLSSWHDLLNFFVTRL